MDSAGSVCSSNDFNLSSNSSDEASNSSDDVSDNVPDYEVTVVVSEVTVDSLTIMILMNEQWRQVELKLKNLIIMNNGVSENKVKVGSMGIMKVNGCHKCIFKAEYNWDKLHSICLGLHGPNQEGGTIVRKDGDKLVIRLSSAPASRVARLVLVHDKRLVNQFMVTEGDNVRVWFYSRKLPNNNLSFNEGVALLPSSYACCSG